MYAVALGSMQLLGGLLWCNTLLRLSFKRTVYLLFQVRNT